MLRKFEFGEADLSATDPRRALKEAWRNFVQNCHTYRDELEKLDEERFYSALDPKVKTIEEVDTVAAIELKLPDVANSMAAIRKALDSLIGWRIEWQEPRRRQPAWLDNYSGWIKGATVGLDIVMESPLAVRIEIAFERDKTGIHYNFGQLYSIMLLPPDTIV